MAEIQLLKHRYPYSFRYVDRYEEFADDPVIAKEPRLLEAARLGDYYTAERLLKEGISVESTDADGFTSLHWAIMSENIGMASFLMNRGANPNAYCSLHRCTPISLAVKSGNVQLLHFLLEHGGDITYRNQYGANLLLQAAGAGTPLTVEYLVLSFLFFSCIIITHFFCFDRYADVSPINLTIMDILPCIMLQ